jgi:hypothetical protein
MATKALEMRQPTGVDRRHDPHCRACNHRPPKGEISASDLWEWTRRQPTPVSPFRPQQR